MTETRGFVNPDVNTNNDSDVDPYWEIWPDDSGINRWKKSEWDLKVILTKKAKPIEAGHWVYEDGVNVYVLAVAGQWAWITSYPHDLHDDNLLPDRVVKVSTLEAQ